MVFVFFIFKEKEKNLYWDNGCMPATAIQFLFVVVTVNATWRGDTNSRSWFSQAGCHHQFLLGKRSGITIKQAFRHATWRRLYPSRQITPITNLSRTGLNLEDKLFSSSFIINAASRLPGSERIISVMFRIPYYIILGLKEQASIIPSRNHGNPPMTGTAPG